MASTTTDILIVGKTGNGKSATANSIVGFNAFVSTSSTQSVTKVAQFEYGEFEERKIKVVDGPGIHDNSDSSRSTKDALKLVIDAMTIAVAANPTGYHVILLVARFGDRFTKEDIKTIRVLKEIFGADFIKYHSILLMTHRDNLNTEEDGTFENWISNQKGEVQELVKECCGRVICFDNKTKDVNVKMAQNRQLFNMIDCLAGNGMRYTSDIFEKAKKTRDRLLTESKRPQLSEECLMECGLITQQFARIDYENPEKILTELESLKNRADLLEQNIIQQDQGTSSLKVAITLVKQLKESIIERTNGVNEAIRMKEQTEKLKLQLKKESIRLQTEEESIKQEAKYRWQEEEIRKQEVERTKQEDLEKQKKQLAQLQDKFERQEKEFKKFVKEKEEEKLKEVERIKSTYNVVKKEESSVWGSVAKALAGTVVGLVKWLWT